MANGASRVVITDLTIEFYDATDASPAPALDNSLWHRIEKDLFLHSAQRGAYVKIAQAKETELSSEDLVVTDIRVGKPTDIDDLNQPWQSQPGGLWVLRKNYHGSISEVVTGVDVLFGTDAVDPRPKWQLQQEPLQLEAAQEVPVARLTIRHGSAQLGRRDPPVLQVRKDGTFKIVQISDTHMVTGVGSCKDAIDGDGHFLPESVADPLTVKFLGEILDVEKPDLVLLTGDQVHHDIPDTQSALFKVAAPLIERSIPYAAVFGNHDSEGAYALSRREQMSILQDLPFSLCQAGPEQVDGVGNHYLQVLGSEGPVLNLYFLDSHEQIASDVHNPDYDPIKQSQIEWFKTTSQALRKERERQSNGFHASLAFLHIPLPEFGREDLIIKAGTRREPTEGPSENTHFYDVLVEEGVAAIGCGHDHVNDFCAMLPQANASAQKGPWLCYGGGSGFGGYCSYGKERFHRRTRVWELEAKKETIRTWKRVEYAPNRVDELVLVGKDTTFPAGTNTCESSAQAIL